MTTGQKIAARRKELELSQEALGDKLGVSRQTVYKWESDLSLPDIDKLVALSRLFQVPVGWLLGERFMLDRLEPSPIFQYDHHYSFDKSRHPMRYVYHIQRDELFADLFEKLPKLGQ